jgi:hypothetical protein
MSEKTVHIVFKVLNFLHSAESKSLNLLDSEKLLLINLASHKGQNGIYPSITTIAKEMKKGYSTIKRLLNSLKEKDLILIHYQRGRVNSYSIKLSTTQLTDEPTTHNLPSSSMSPHPAHRRATPQLMGEPLYNKRNNKENKREGSLVDFCPDESNEVLCQDLRLDLTHELQSFKNRHRGKATQYEFSRWLKNSKEYQSKKGNGEVRSNVPWFTDNH